MSSTADEEWRAVIGFEGLYEVSNFGRVRSLNRTLSDGRRWKGQPIKTYANSKAGHQSVKLSRGGSDYQHRQVHRMVAEAFIPNPNDFPVVRHLDDVPTNNQVSNLAWGTYSDNLYDAIRNGNRLYEFATKVACKNGHEYTEENSFFRKDRRARECRQCMRDRSNKRYWEMRDTK